VRERVPRASVVSTPGSRAVSKWPRSTGGSLLKDSREWRDLFTGTAGPREISRGNARVHLPLRQRGGGGWREKNGEREESKLVSANVARVTRVLRRLVECFSIFPSRVLPASSLISLSNKSVDLYNARSCASREAFSHEFEIGDLVYVTECFGIEYEKFLSSESPFRRFLNKPPSLAFQLTLDGT